MIGQTRGGRFDQVVLITGASSGIGRATALAFARRGARLVLAARSAFSLDEVAAECADHGAQVRVVPTDVSDEAQVRALAQTTVEAFGRIDVCVAGASVYSYGTFEQTPPQVFRQIVETNLFGPIHTARAVLPHFRAQERGVLIIIGSIYSKITSPYVSPYVTSKFGLLGFTEVLRQELRQAKNVHVCAVLPATIDTPIYQHAANYTGQRIHPLPPVTAPERVARAVLQAVARPRPVIVVGQVQRGFIPVHAFLPRLYNRCIGPVMDTLALRGGAVAPSAGTVFDPAPETNRITGGWRSGRWRLVGLVGATALAGAVVKGIRSTPARSPHSP